MKAQMTLMIFLIILICSGNCYSLEGRWSVKNQYFPTNTSVSISFDKQLNETNNRIQYFMNIFACKLLRYKYIVVDNEIYFTFDSEVTQRYDCKSNQIQSLKSKIQKSFYFIIIGTQLSLYGPNNEAQMKLTRVPVSESKSLSGEWLSVDVGGSPISESISISESQLELCGGKGVVSYSYSELSKPMISFNVMKTGGCVQNEIYSSLSRSVFMRWKGTGLVYLYNGEYEQIMSMRRIGEKVVNSTIVSNVVSNVTNVNVNINNNNIANSNVQNIQSVNQDSSTKYNSNVINNQQKPTTQQINQQNTQQTVINQPKTQSQNQNIQIQNQNIQISNQQTTTPSINTNTQTTSQSQSSITKYSSISDLPSLTKTDLQGKWIIKDNNSDFSSSSYFFLILPDKIMLYGGCNVHFSTYTLNQTTLNNINLQSTSKSCPQIPQPFKSLLQKFKSWKYLALKNDNNKFTLQILNSKFTTLNNLEKIA